MNTPQDANPFSFVTTQRRSPRSVKRNGLDKTYFAISNLDVEEDIKAGYRERAEKYFKECGCSMGALFVIAALAFSIFHWLFFSTTFLPSLTSILLVFSAAIFGKLLGIGIGRIKLFVLFKKLSMGNSARRPHLPERR